MYGLKKLLTMEEERLQKLKQTVDSRLDLAPEGNLRITSSGKIVQYMQCTDENDKSKTQGKYIKKDNTNLITGLAQKGYDQKIKRLVDKRLKQIQTLSKDYSDDEIEMIYNKMNDKRKSLILPVEPIYEQYLAQWKSIPYVGKGFENVKTEIYSNKGERMRSKSEKFLADMFYSMGIEYKYECPLYLKGYGIVYPDFTFLSKETFEEIYWEHEGRMDDADYVEKAIRKIDQYTKNNIIPGKRLILTYESSTYALNTSVAEMLIREHFL